MDKLDAKAEEVREVTRAANELLKDLLRVKGEIEKMVKTGFEERIADCVRRSENTIGRHLNEFATAMRTHSDKIQRAIINRWRYIEMMTATDLPMVHLVAVHVIQEAGGSLETEGAKYHLVKEEVDPGGGSAFYFASKLTRRAEGDRKLDEALQKAVNEYELDANVFTFLAEREGPEGK